MLNLHKWIRNIFGSPNERLLRRLRPVVQQINALEASMQRLSDNELRDQIRLLRSAHLQEGVSLDDLLPRCFAVVREASVRVLGLRHFDEQLLGAMVLHQGKITEMRTGEGKTLVATLAAVLNALPAKGVHVVTVNDYLVQRDASWMGPLYEFLGLTVGYVIAGLSTQARKRAYEADITYATNSEMGFDYLRDHMKFLPQHLVQRPFHYVIVDEVDSIFIDEARTPLIISGPSDDHSHLYHDINRVIPRLVPEDYEVDEKQRSVFFTDKGHEHLEELLVAGGFLPENASLYEIEHWHLMHHANQALRAHRLYKRDVEYIVQAGKVVLIDDFTGRVMEGRRFSEGLHQALEAKEGVTIQQENQTLASITYQNYFRQYPKIAGMTGTALTEAAEFEEIYRLSVVDIPPHRSVARVDEDDIVYSTEAMKMKAIVERVKLAHEAGQPVLIGTVSIERSEHYAREFTKQGIAHQVLNARHHDQEAMIIAQAGRLGAVTIATNMAGRGTDIVLGGNAELLAQQAFFERHGTPSPETEAMEEALQSLTAHYREVVEKERAQVLEAGGLLVIGTERHESRRIDNQLRGRSGRQGDPGRTVFFISMEDDLMRIFGSERLSSMLTKLGLKEDESIVHPLISKTIEKAQQRVESRNFDLRKNLLRFDDVMNDQRRIIYDLRVHYIHGKDLSEDCLAMRERTNRRLIAQYLKPGNFDPSWDLEGLGIALKRLYDIPFPVDVWEKEALLTDADILETIEKQLVEDYSRREMTYSAYAVRLAEKQVLLMLLDQFWKDHLHHLDQLRQGINLRAYGQKDPLLEYRRDAFELFEAMLDKLDEEVVRHLFHFELEAFDLSDQAFASLDEDDQHHHYGDALPSPEGSDALQAPSRNSPCPCGSRKKFKYCHGRVS